METKTAAVKTGPVTLALGLIALGAGALAVNLGLISAGAMLRFWPVLLIGLGLEYFIRKMIFRDSEVQFNVPAVTVTVLMALALWSANTIYNFSPLWLLNELIDRHGNERTTVWQGDPVEIVRGSRLEIENNAGSVEISPSPDGKLHVSALITGPGSPEESPPTSAKEERIIVEPGQVTKIYTRHEDRQFERIKLKVWLPEGLSVSVSNKLGGVVSRNISAEMLSVESSAGTVEVDGHRGGLEVENKLGETTVKNVDGTVKIEGAAGRINIINPMGNVIVESGNGSIRLNSSAPLDKNYELRGENGEITFSAPRSSSLKVEASSHNGGISGIESRRSHGLNKGEAVLGDGRGSALLEMKNGSIRFELTN